MSRLEAFDQRDSTFSANIVLAQKYVCDGLVGLARGFLKPVHARASGARIMGKRSRHLRGVSCHAMSVWHVVFARAMTFDALSWTVMS